MKMTALVKNVRFGLAAALPAGVIGALFCFGTMKGGLIVFAAIWTPLVLLRGSLHCHRHSIFRAALVYAMIIACLPLFPWFWFMAAVHEGVWPEATSLFLVGCFTLVGWVMVGAAAFLGFGIPTAAWLREVNDKLDCSSPKLEASSHA